MLKVLYNLLWAIALTQGVALLAALTTIFVVLPIVLLATQEPLLAIKDITLGVWCVGHVIGAGMFFISLDKTESLYRAKEEFIKGVQRGFKSSSLGSS